MSTKPQLNSGRFDLIPIEHTPDGNGHLIEMMQNAQIQRFLNGSPLSDSEALVGLARFHRYDDDDLGYWLIYDTGQNCVGMCLLKHLPSRDKTNLIETGYWIKPAFWGQRIAAEVTCRLLKYAFLDLALEKVIAVVDPENIASSKSLQRAGLIRRGHIHAYGAELPLYVINKAEFNNTHREYASANR